MCLMRVTKARRNIKLANSPLKKKRARMIAKYRKHVAGSGMSPSQTRLSSEIKLLSETSKLSVCAEAGVQKKAVLKDSQQLAQSLQYGYIRCYTELYYLFNLECRPSFWLNQDVNKHY